MISEMKSLAPALVLLLSCPAAHAQEKLVLPNDPDAVVLSLDFQGGYAPKRKNQAPYLEVRADGSLRVPDRSGGEPDLVGKLSPKELKELLDFVIDEQRILDFDAERVQAAMRAAKGKALPVVCDAADTVITVVLAGRRKEARLNALEYYARACPKVEELQRLAAISRRLRTIMCVVQLGGEKEVAKLLIHANAALAAKWPSAKPLVTRDLSSVMLARDGARTAWLQRRGENETLSATLRVSPEGEVEVELQREPVED